MTAPRDGKLVLACSGVNRIALVEVKWHGAALRRDLIRPVADIAALSPALLDLESSLGC